MDNSNTSPMFNVPVPIMEGSLAPSVRTPQKKGRGVLGVGEDILGTLGDILLTKLGVGPMYGPAKRQKKLNAAFQDFENDPVGAIKRVSEVDFKTGQDLSNTFVDNQRQQAALESTKEARDARLEMAKNAEASRVRGTAASMLNTLTEWSPEKRAKDYPILRDRVRALATKSGTPIDIPDTYDENTAIDLEALIAGSIPAGTQRSQTLTRKRNEAQVETAKTSAQIRREAAAERRRHNLETEGQGRARIAKQGSGGGSAKAPRVTNVQTYVDENNDKVTVRSDGSVVKSPTKVRQAGSSKAIRRIVNGQVYELRNGKPVLVQ